MHDDELDVFDSDDSDAPGEGPFLRATVTRDRIWLNLPVPGLITCGPVSMNLERLQGRSVLVDLRVVGEGDELAASIPPNAPRIDRRSSSKLANWAAVVGYKRLWLPGQVIELAEPEELLAARVECPTCGSEWADSSPSFWEMVRGCGHFPGYCSACAGSLPEWNVSPQKAASVERRNSVACRSAEVR